jgi:hypothetical protein
MNEWTTGNLRIPTLNRIRDEANRRKKKRLPNASNREVCDEAAKLGLDAISESRRNNTINPQLAQPS